MKRRILQKAVFLLIICLVLVMVAGCGEEKATAVLVFKAGDQGTSVEVETAEFEGSLLALLKSDSYASKIKAQIDETTYEGMVFLVSIGGITPDPSSEYIAVYTTLSEFSSGEEFQKTIDGTLYYYSSVGIAELPLQADATYLFLLESFVQS